MAAELDFGCVHSPAGTEQEGSKVRGCEVMGGQGRRIDWELKLPLGGVLFTGSLLQPVDDVIQIGCFLLAQIVVPGVSGRARGRDVCTRGRATGGRLCEAEEPQSTLSTAGAWPG